MVSNDSNIWVCLEIMGKNYGSSPFSRLKWPYTMLERNLPTFRPVLWLVVVGTPSLPGGVVDFVVDFVDCLAPPARESGNQQGRSNSKSLKSLKITISSLSKSLAFVFEEIQLTVEDKSDKSSRAFRISKRWFCLRMMEKHHRWFIAIFPIIFTWLYIGGIHHFLTQWKDANPPTCKGLCSDWWLPKWQEHHHNHLKCGTSWSIHASHLGSLGRGR